MVIPQCQINWKPLVQSSVFLIIFESGIFESEATDPVTVLKFLKDPAVAKNGLNWRSSYCMKHFTFYYKKQQKKGKLFF